MTNLANLAGQTAGEEFIRDMDWYVDDANSSGDPREFWRGFSAAVKESGFDFEALRHLLPAEAYDDAASG